MSGYTSAIDTAPPFVTGTFDANDVRLATMLNALPGIYEFGDFAVSQRAAGAAMSVDIAQGRALLDPRATTHQGIYLGYRTNATAYNTSADGGYTWTAADAANPRIDLLCVEAADTSESGSYTGIKFRVIDGTPAAGATHQLNVTNWPAIPSGCVPIAAIRVPALATTLTTANISSLNPVGGHRKAYSVCTSNESTTSATYVRLTTPDFVMVYNPVANGRIRLYSEGMWESSGVQTGGVTLFLNDTQLKVRNGTNGAPAAGEYNLASMTTFKSRFNTVASQAAAAATAQFYSSVVGATADVSQVTTGLAGALTTIGAAGAIEIGQLAVGWYLIEQRYKIAAAATLEVDERYMWAEAIG